MLDKLIDVLTQIWEKLLPFEVINHYDRGVRLRYGRAVMNGESVRILGPGLHWKIPFVDDINSHMVKMTTMDLTEQTITTKDRQSVVVRGVLKYEVSDVATVLLETDGPAAAVADISMGLIKDAFAEKNWEDCNDPELPSQIAIKIRREAKKWGIDVKMLTFTDLGLIRSIRLITKQ